MKESVLHIKRTVHLLYTYKSCAETLYLLAKFKHHSGTQAQNQIPAQAAPSGKFSTLIKLKTHRNLTILPLLSLSTQTTF